MKVRFQAYNGTIAEVEISDDVAEKMGLLDMSYYSIAEQEEDVD